MNAIIEIRRLNAAGCSQQQIARACKLSKGTVGKYLQRAAEAQITWPLPEGLSPAAVEQRLCPRSSALPLTRPVPPDCARIHTELRRNGVTLLLLWEEYVAAHAGERTYQYAQFYVHYRAWKARLKSSMRQYHRAGEKLLSIMRADGTCRGSRHVLYAMFGIDLACVSCRCLFMPHICPVTTVDT